MGIYVSNRVFGEAYDYAAEIPANEAYDAAFGCAHILADRVDNDRALFESVIRSDIAEVMAVREGYEVVNEGVIGDVLKKIVEMFKKIIAKIKGIFNAFLAKLTGAFKNGKDLVKKYEKQILTYSGTWKKFKFKGIRKPKSDNIRNAIDTVFANSGFTNNGVSVSRYNIKQDSDIFNALNGGNDNLEELTSVYDAGLGANLSSVKQIQNAETDELKLALLKQYVKLASGKTISDYKDMDEEIKDYLYDDEDTIDGDDERISGSYFSADWIKPVLQDDKWESNVKKVNEKLEKAINNIIDVLQKSNENIAKFRNDNNDTKAIGVANNTGFGINGKITKDTSVSKGTALDAKETVVQGRARHAKKANEFIQKIVQTMQKIASNEQAVISDVTAKYMENVKFAMAQARKMWTAAAAYTSTTHKESYEYDNAYIQAVAECAEEQFYANMESIH